MPFIVNKDLRLDKDNKFLSYNYQRVKRKESRLFTFRLLSFHDQHIIF